MPEEKKYKVISTSNPANLEEQLNAAENASYKLVGIITQHPGTLVAVLVIN